MAIVRIPIVSTLDPEVFSDDGFGAGMASKNAIFNKYADGTTYAGQRPSLRFFVGASTGDGKPRGIFYWEVTDTTYIVDNDTLFKGGYGASVVSTISAGTQPVKFIPNTPTSLLILDPENDEVWSLSDAEALTAVTGTYFPTDFVDGDWLNTYLFLMDSQGVIYNSTPNAATDWTTVGVDNYVTAERNPDKGIALVRQSDHLVAIGSDTIEFFYDAGTTPSPLARRPDVFYKVGAFSTEAVFNSGEAIYFIGSEPTGSLGVYRIADMKISKISTDGIDKYINRMLVRNLPSGTVRVTGGSIGNHPTIYITFFGAGAGDFYDPRCTLVFDGLYETWSVWETTFNALNAFPVMGVSSRFGNTQRSQFLLFFDGSVAEYTHLQRSVDTAGEGEYVIDDYLQDQDDYIESLDFGSNSDIVFILRTSEYDGGTMSNKFGYRLDIVGDRTGLITTDTDTPIKIRWTDNHYRSWSTYQSLTVNDYRDLELSDLKYHLPRIGKFNRRIFEIYYDGQEPLKIEALEMDIRASKYA